MKKTAVQFLVIAVLVAAIWFALSRVNWPAVLKVDKAKDNTEEELGDAAWKFLKSTETEIYSRTINNAVDSMMGRICERNDIDRDKIKVHVLQNKEVNAFALPGNHLVVYTGLLENAQNEAEVMGVLGHEIAHLQKKHVMKKLVKEIGLSALIAMTTGSKGSETIGQVVRMLSSTAYDRDLEREADITSVDYLLKAEVDPEPFANFLYRLSDENEDTPKQLYWISTHPESKERATDILDYAKGKKITKTPVLSQEQWDKLKEKLKNED